MCHVLVILHLLLLLLLGNRVLLFLDLGVIIPLPDVNPGMRVDKNL